MQIRMWRWLSLAMLMAPSAMQSQIVGSNLAGKVTSITGGAIPNATVTATNTTTNVNQSTATGHDGSFSISGLTAGTYRVQVEGAGFKRAVLEGVAVSSSQSSSLNIVLEAGGTSQTVHVVGTTPAVQAENGQVFGSLETRTIQELPVVDRSEQQLAGLEAGITPPQSAADAVRVPPANRFYSTNGQAPDLNVHYIDGVVNLEPFRGTAVRVIPDESIGEMTIATANLTTNRGFTSGAFVLKNSAVGANSWHGSLFEFHSDSDLRTRDFFNVPGNLKPGFTYNQFGGTVGGPIMKDKTFIFGSYEGTLNHGQVRDTATVPVPAAAGGDFSAIPGLTIYSPFSGNASGSNRVPFAGNMIQANQINPTAAAIAGYIPAPNQPGFVNNYVTNMPFQNDAQKADGRIDHQFTDRTSGFVRYGYSNGHVMQESVLGTVIGAGTFDRLLSQDAMLAATHAFSDSLVADFRFGYNRYDQRLGAEADQTPLQSMLGLGTGANNLTNVLIPGLPAIGTPAYVPQNAVDNTFNWASDWSLHRHSQNIKWGVDARAYRSDGFLDTGVGSMFGPNGAAYFGPGATLPNGMSPLPQYGAFYNAFAAFLLGTPSQQGATSFLTTPTVRQTQFGLWAGDTIQIRHRLTVDVGVRYELYTPLAPRRPGGAAFFDPATNEFNYAGIGNISMRPYGYDYDNFAPRVGFAYRVNDKTVIRGGYGINYFQEPYLLTGFLAPMAGLATGVQGTYTTAGMLAPALSNTIFPGAIANGAPAGNLPVTWIPQQLSTPYIQTFSLQVQREFFAGMMLSAGYVGTVGRHLPYMEELNAALPGTGVAGLPYAGLGRTGTTLLSDNALTDNYNSLQVRLSKRFSHGLSFLASYTWSKALGYTGENNLLLNPFDLQSNYGPLDWDRQQVFTFSHVWDIPLGRSAHGLESRLLGGWQVNGVFTWATGTPVTVTADPLLCNCPGNTVLAGINGPATGTPATGGATIFDPAAFYTPAGANIAGLTRNAVRGPGFRNYDLAVFKNFRVLENWNVQVRGEAYNISNSTHFANPVSDLSLPAFGQATDTLNGAFGRQINFALRLTF